MTNSRYGTRCTGSMWQLVDLLDGGAGTSRGVATGHATGHATLRGTTSSLVHLGDDGVAHGLEVLLHALELVLLGVLGGLEPLHDLLDLVVDSLGLVLGHGALELVLASGVLHLVAVALDALLGVLVLISVLLGLTHHAVNVVLGETALVVGDGNVGLLAGGTLVLGRDVEHTIGVDVEGDLDLGHATGGRGDASELELAEEVVVLGAGALALVHLDQHTRLVVGVGGEGLGLLGGHGGVTGDEGGHDTTSGLEAEGQRGDVEEEEVGLAGGAT